MKASNKNQALHGAARRFLKFGPAGLLAILSLAAGATSANAQGPTFAAIFGDHAVLQRDQPITLWGKAPAHAAVTVKLGSESVQAVADGAGKWRATLRGMAAGGPHVLSASANGATTALNDILVGDVFLCGGQSNMEQA